MALFIDSIVVVVCLFLFHLAQVVIPKFYNQSGISRPGGTVARAAGEPAVRGLSRVFVTQSREGRTGFPLGQNGGSKLFFSISSFNLLGFQLLGLLRTGGWHRLYSPSSIIVLS